MGTITVTNLGKAYKQYPSRWSRLGEWLDPQDKPRHRLHWALKDVNFSIESGEAVGIVGINGAGKSTLLKMIAGTVLPTTGIISISGRVAALLELGMGFHPDFTGRQNVYMAGQLLGLTKGQITDSMAEIEQFAEIADYIDQPVRVYSSGMQVRLAFSLAVCVRPDVLIVDEALSVGDIVFQQKCMNRIREFRESGTTILLVTHDIGALSSICDRMILIAEGTSIFDGPVSQGIENYFSELASRKSNWKEYVNNELELSQTYISDLRISSRDGHDGLLFEGEKAFVTLRLQNLESFADPHVGIRIQDRHGLIAFEANTFGQGVMLRDQVGDSLDDFELELSLTINLSQGEYTLAVGIENEGQLEGDFKSVILPTQIVRGFSVVRRSLPRAQWSGHTNLYVQFKPKKINYTANMK